MKNLIFLAMLAIIVCVPTGSASAQEWTLEGSGFKAKGGSRVEISKDPKLAVSASLTATHLNLVFADGKQKFGAAVIGIQSGENVFMLPRLKLSVPAEEVKGVKSGTPLLVSSFSVRGRPFKAHLVHSGGPVPNIVITGQAETSGETAGKGKAAK